MNPTQFFTSVAFPGYLPDCDTADEPIDADCLADDLREEWRMSLESEAARRESEGSPMDDREYAERESVGERRARTVERILKLGRLSAFGINAELPDGQVWEAVGA
jgi:hypothetical protein